MTGHSVLQLPVPALEGWVRDRTAHYDAGFVSADPRFGHAHVTALGPFVATWMKANPVAHVLPSPAISYGLVVATVLTLLALLAIGTAARALRAARLDPAVALRID